MSQGRGSGRAQTTWDGTVRGGGEGTSIPGLGREEQSGSSSSSSRAAAEQQQEQEQEHEHEQEQEQEQEKRQSKEQRQSRTEQPGTQSRQKTAKIDKRGPAMQMEPQMQDACCNRKRRRTLANGRYQRQNTKGFGYGQRAPE
jgi:hypothetical protein